MLSTAAVLLALSHKKQCDDPQPIHSEWGKLRPVLPCTSPLRLQSTLQFRVSPPHCAQWQQKWDWYSFFAADGPLQGVCPKGIYLCMYTHVCNAAWTRQYLSGCWRGWRNHPLHLFSSPQQTSEFLKWTWWDEVSSEKKWVKSQKWAILFILNKMMCDDQSKINEPSELLLESSQLLQGILLLSDEPYICPVNPVYHSCWLFLAFIFHYNFFFFEKDTETINIYFIFL